MVTAPERVVEPHGLHPFTLGLGLVHAVTSAMSLYVQLLCKENAVLLSETRQHN